MSKRKKSKSSTSSIYIIGSDSFNMKLLENMPDADKYYFIPTLDMEDTNPGNLYVDFDELYATARKKITEHERKPDAIIGHYDFPVTSLVPLLRRDFEIPGASPESVAKLEHKYWMRKEQEKIFPDTTPDYVAINPFDPAQARKDIPDYPFWLKPVMGHSSMLGFMVEDDDDFERALHACRQEIHALGEPFTQFLAHLDNKNEIGEIDGNYAVAESLISAPEQFTLEGYVHNENVTIYGVINSLRQGKHNSSFACYKYPGKLPDAIIKKATDYTQRFLNYIEYDDAAFNIEFFWDPETDVVNLLEINPRISKSHSPLFDMVDGSTHHKVPIDLCLGKKPQMPEKKGNVQIAGKFMLRSFEKDGIVKQVPSQDKIDELKRIFPDMSVHIHVNKDQKLSTLPFQDSYSYEIAVIFLGAENEEMLIDMYERCQDSLDILIKPMPAEELAS